MSNRVAPSQDSVTRLREAYWEWMAARQARYYELVGGRPHLDPAGPSLLSAHEAAVRQINEEQRGSGSKVSLPDA